ncbi:MAG: hypothetical protein K2Y26_12380 [Gemmatimonadaceae bacterium]|nr:hypothetical protein [Gemmatimonadaceae bacterium]
MMPTDGRDSSREAAPDPLDRRLDRWAHVVAEIESGYSLTFDDYLNDLDLRHGLRALPADDARQAALRELDARFKAHTYPSGSCVWGDDNAEAEGWDRERDWYYWRLPTHPGPAFPDT